MMLNTHFLLKLIYTTRDSPPLTVTLTNQLELSFNIKFWLKYIYT